MAMNVIARKALQVFWRRYPQAEIPLGTWYQIVSKGEWSGPADLKRAFGNNVDFLGDNRAIFDIGGNKYRLVVRVNYPYRVMYVRFVGTHAQYDRTNVEEI